MFECLPDLPRYIRQRDNEWQGADHPGGPWRPIPAPQAGLPWLTDEPAVPESREPASVAANPTHLTPAAQAVWDAWSDAYEAQGPLEDMGQPLGAALRAAADRAVPAVPFDRRYITKERWDAGDDIRAELLAIAAELEGSNG